VIAPVTTIGALVLHTAEVLSGLTIAQLVRPGTPVVFGGAPVVNIVVTGALADRVLIYTEDGDPLVAGLLDDGLRPLSVLVRRSTLEDVFLMLTGRTLVED